MDAKPMGELMNGLALQPQELALSKSGDQKFIQCLRSKKISECSLEELKQPLRLAMLKVGIREHNMPQGEEKQVLIHHIITNYGGNRIEEIVLAFEMAIAGKLDIDEKEVNAYENFSCIYVSRIMNSYRRWAINEYKDVEKTISPLMKQLPGPEVHQSWGMLIESEYQHYLSFGGEHVTIWPAGFYDQLVTDGMIEKDYFRYLMPSIRKKLIGDLINERNKISFGTVKGMSKDRKEFVESIKQTNIDQVEKKIAEYKKGEKDAEIELAAKQYSVLKLFKAAKDKFRENIYRKSES